MSHTFNEISSGEDVQQWLMEKKFNEEIREIIKGNKQILDINIGTKVPKLSSVHD